MFHAVCLLPYCIIAITWPFWIARDYATLSLLTFLLLHDFNSKSSLRCSRRTQACLEKAISQQVDPIVTTGYALCSMLAGLLHELY